MGDINATFYVPSDKQSGMLTGGFVDGTELSNPGSLNVTVIYPADGNGVDFPPTLTGTFVLTASPLANSNQSAPSPFTVSASNPAFKCITAISTLGAPMPNGTVSYGFSGIPYPGGQRGQFELTFIAADGDTQWSIDPEFDTTN